ncbi:MAG: hypothetical protein AAFN77_16800 [Planctomycetota bacterium]
MTPLDPVTGGDGVAVIPDPVFDLQPLFDCVDEARDTLAEKFNLAQLTTQNSQPVAPVPVSFASVNMDHLSFSIPILPEHIEDAGFKSAIESMVSFGRWLLVFVVAVVYSFRTVDLFKDIT